MPIIFYATPQAACVTHCGAPVVAIRAFERGYHPIYTKAQPSDLNGGKFTLEEVEAAIIGSMFGWNCPGAKPAVIAIERIEELEAREPVKG